MPWTWLARTLFAVILYRVLQRRRQGLPGVDAGAVRRRVDSGLQAGLVAARVITSATLAVATVLVGTAAASMLVLGPRWLGGALGAVAVIFAVAAVQEGLLLRRELLERRRRARARAVAEEVERPHVV